MRRSIRSAAGPILYQCVLRLLAKSDAPVKALIGPWAHDYPHNARPGPQIGFLQESLRWWDRWLKGIDNGVTEEPALHAWIQDSAPPASDYDQRDGRWIAAATWPPPVPPHVMHFADGRLSDAAVPAAPILTHRSPRYRHHDRRMVPLWQSRRAAHRSARG